MCHKSLLILAELLKQKSRKRRNHLKFLFVLAAKHKLQRLWFLELTKWAGGQAATTFFSFSMT